MSDVVTIDLVDPTPPFEQVRRQLTLLIETGQLVTGCLLYTSPSPRD